MKELRFVWNIIGLASSLGIVNKSVVRSVNPQTYTLYCAENGRVGKFNPFCINCLRIWNEPCDYLQLNLDRLDRGDGGWRGVPGSAIVDPLEWYYPEQPKNRITNEDIKIVFKKVLFKESKLAVNIGLEFIDAGLLGGLILGKIADKIFDEIQKSDKDLKDMPELEIEKLIYGILKLKGFADWNIGITKIVNSTGTKNIKIIFKTTKKEACLIC